MSIDPGTLIMSLLGLVVTGVSWWVKNLWSMLAAQQVQITQLQVELARNYMPRAEVQEALRRIFEKLDEIQTEVVKR